MYELATFLPKRGPSRLLYPPWEFFLFIFVYIKSQEDIKLFV